MTVDEVPVKGAPATSRLSVVPTATVNTDSAAATLVRILGATVKEPDDRARPYSPPWDSRQPRHRLFSLFYLVSELFDAALFCCTLR